MRKRGPLCATCGQREKGVFCNLVGDQLEELDRVKTVQKYRRGQILFHEGQPAPALFCIYSGRVKVYKTGARDEEHIIRLLGPTEIVGFRPILAGEPCAATAEAIEPATLCVFPPTSVFDLIRRMPEFSMALLAKLARELRASEEQFMTRAQESVRRRVARILLTLHRSPGTPGATRARPVVPVRRTEIAQMVGTTPETLSRVLHELAGQGLVRVTRTEIQVADLKALRQVAGDLP